MPANYKDGIIRDGSSIGSGTILGNIKNGIVYKGTYSSPGNGSILGNFKDGVIWEGTYSSPGNGKIILNEKAGDVFKGTYSSRGNGTKIGKISDYKILGMERELNEAMVAAYHFLVKKLV